MQILFKRLSPDVPIPEYKTAGAVAFDIAVPKGGVIQPGETKFFSTGLVIKVPDGYVLLVAPRSSNAKKQIRMGNSIGLIDQDYCGPTDELKLALNNFGSEPYTVKDGERIAQSMIVPIAKGEFIETADLGTPDRGGFGSTG
ncbi:MAG: Deoxyuridine 5'-triphosphate nucleotidohydrolase Dut [Candidatus Uhrbacteria bacterium GW2011_GWE2_45_35]|uniref:dUTP diphosphatase n=1 Tax=Candidatus Uhrbacteria bacterium GW2011_GWE2_45_35 TaxID=1618993 RepID=A0A0G1MFD6_9BACT|nr:MAG: Deoxyuridine 5'-triphosphate nucleotidohydrolase Dut [Candidatus Uhrbacteria bacterium GW2011_GWE2_45_35]HBR80974.1 dUTP diphosphatase [Candidatus Uhrbacteria bacterium]HCU31923.1 dUTP diphosphatase [Candidatus Uhrbacteria bacterium]